VRFPSLEYDPVILVRKLPTNEQEILTSLAGDEGRRQGRIKVAGKWRHINRLPRHPCCTNTVCNVVAEHNRRISRSIPTIKEHSVPPRCALRRIMRPRIVNYPQPRREPPKRPPPWIAKQFCHNDVGLKPSRVSISRGERQPASSGNRAAQQLHLVLAW
jgi:transposase